MMEILKRVISESKYPFASLSRLSRLILLNILFLSALLLVGLLAGKAFESQANSMQSIAESVSAASQNEAAADELYSRLLTAIFRGIIYIILFILAVLILLSILNSYLIRWLVKPVDVLTFSRKLLGMYSILFVMSIIILYIPVYPMAKIIQLGGSPGLVFVLAFYVLLFLLLHYALISTLVMIKKKTVFSSLKAALRLIFRRFWNYAILYLVIIVGFILYLVINLLIVRLHIGISATLSAILVLVLLVWSEALLARVGESCLKISEKART